MDRARAVAPLAIESLDGVHAILNGLAIAAALDGLFDTLVPRSPLWGVLVEAVTFFLLLTYVLKARGLTSAAELTHGLFGSPPATAIEGPSAS